MNWRTLLSVTIVLALTAATSGRTSQNKGSWDDRYKSFPEPPEFQWLPLQRAHLEKLAGTWELAVDSPTGWKGTLRAQIKVSDAKGKDGNALDYGAGSIHYEADLRRGNDARKITNVPPGGIRFTGKRQGERLYLVPPKKLGGRLVPFTLSGDRLALDASGNPEALFPPEIRGLRLSWRYTEWKRLKEK
jgi:hypothetical protein